MKNKEIWSVDCMIDVFECDGDSFDQIKIKTFAQEISKIIDPGKEILGIVNPFGEHEDRMKGIRLIHENENSLITGHFVDKDFKFFINVMSCAPYKVSKVIDVIKKTFKTENYLCRRALREYGVGDGKSE